MEKETLDKSFGVIKPVGHVVASFADEPSARQAQAALAEAGFASEDVHFLTAEEVVRSATQDIQNAGFLASVGQELNLVKAHLELARQGHPFVIVKAESDEATHKVAEIATRFGADRAQKYGRLIIEELIEPGTGERQSAESPDRGLDAQTVSGREAT